MMKPDDRIRYLAEGAGDGPDDRERLDLVRAVLADESTWAEPPPDVGDELISEITGDGVGSKMPVPSTFRRWRWITVGIAAAIAGVFVLTALIGSGDQPVETLVAMSGTELGPTATGEVTLRAEESGWWIRLDVSGLPPADVGTFYEGWLWNDEGVGISIGTFHLRGASEPVILWSGVDPADYPSMSVTLEDTDGVAAASGRVMMTGRIGEVLTPSP